jgi:hypothetical protein
MAGARTPARAIGPVADVLVARQVTCGALRHGAVHHDKVRGYIGFPSVRVPRISPGCSKPSQNLPLA